ncbi:unnamed protein product [Meloidogyne enterolobii]|uniref:Uncharacterized protein n=1 Tax=Meloidogyne enterolobii TaxID=390850 RepID=A0ACB1B8Z7_MELEN
MDLLVGLQIYKFFSNQRPDLKDMMRDAGEVTYADAHKRVRNEALVCFATHDDLRRAMDRFQGYCFKV